MKSVLVAAGDGVGPEVVEATLFAMDGLDLDMEIYMEPVGMAGVQERGEAITDDTVELARQVDAVLFGAVETPPPGEGYRSPILTLRRELDLYANVRPARPLVPWLSRTAPAPTETQAHPLEVVVVRENTEGLYSGRERNIEGGAVAEKVVTQGASERICRFALNWARDHGRHLVTAVHKANVLRLSDRVFLDAFWRVAAEDDWGVETSERYVDSTAASMVSDPRSLDVIVTLNLYGDILSDQAAALTGGLGLAPSASYGEDHALFEPVHGSAPDIAGNGIANPVGCMLSAAMMLDHLGHGDKATRLLDAVANTLGSRVTTPDLGGEHTTLGFAEEVRARLVG